MGTNDMTRRDFLKGARTPERERPQAPAAKNTRMTMRRDAHGDAVSLLGYGMMRLPTVDGRHAMRTTCRRL